MDDFYTQETTLIRLDNNNINYNNHTHEPLFTVEQAKIVEHSISCTHTKNLFIKSKKWQFAMITMVASKKLDSKIFRQQSWFGDFSFASAEDLWNQIKIKPWSVGIFGLLNNSDIKLYIDQDIWDSDFIWRHPNDNTATTVINHEWLISYLKILDIDYEIISI